MNPGLYNAFLGMKARQRTLETQANNIANASTDGYKALRLRYTTIEAEKKGDEKHQPTVAGIATESLTDFSAGNIRETGQALDFSIRGEGFFQIQTEEGTRFTRAGSFTLDAAGQLVTKNGDLVVGDEGAITLPANENVSISTDGTITTESGEIAGKIKTVRFENPVEALTHAGNSLFAATGTEEPEDAVGSEVLQGTIESSNINPIEEMVSMINNTREFESLQRSISLMMNDVGRKVATEIGRT